MTVEAGRQTGGGGEAPRVRVLVLTDDRLSAEGIARIFDAGGTEFALLSGPDGHDVTADADVLLLDSRMERAIAVCGELARDSRVPVIMIAAPADDAWAAEAILSGARGILPRNAPSADVFSAMRAVREGVIWAPRRVVSALLDRVATAHTPARAHQRLLEERLSTREREVFHAVARGLGNKELAARLEISEATVKVHLTHIFQKLGVRGRAELAAAWFGMDGIPSGGVEQEATAVVRPTPSDESRRPTR